MSSPLASIESPRPPVDVIGAVVVASGALCAVLSAIAFFLNGSTAAFTGPIMIESVLVLGAIAIRRLRVDRALDGFLVITIIETLRGCIVPVTIQFVGQDSPPFRDLGSADDAVVVLVVANVFFASFLAGSVVLTRLGPDLGRRKASFVDEATVTTAARIIIALGLLGVLLRFPSIQTLLEFFAAGDGGEAPGGVLGFLGSALRPLLPFGIAVLLIQHRRGRPAVVVALTVALAIAGVLALGSFDLNRSAFIFPTIAFVIAWIASSGVRPRARTVGIAATAMTVLFFTVGAIRQFLKEGSPAQATGGGFLREAVQTVLIYGQSPLQSAPALDAQQRLQLWDLTTLWNSLVSPIPGVPESVRSASGPAHYNLVLYGQASPRDQIIPSWLEAYLSAGWLGPIAVGLAAAVTLFFLDRGLKSASSVLSAYAFALSGVWVAQLSINSLSTVGQGLIYFCAVPGLLVAALRLAGSASGRFCAPKESEASR